MPSSETALAAALSCLPMVRTVASRLHRRCPSGTVDREDLIQEGMLEVLDFCERFDSSLGVPLDSAAHARAKGAMLDFLRSGDTLSRQDRQDYRRIRAAESLFHEPCDVSTAQVTGLGLDRVRTLKRLAMEGSVSSLHESLGSGTSVERIDTVPCDRQGPLQLAMRAESALVLSGAVAQLSERDQTILRLRYVQDADMEEIAAHLGITPGGAAKAHAATLKRLRTYLDAATTPVFDPRRSRLHLVWKQRQTPAQTAL